MVFCNGFVLYLLHILNKLIQIGSLIPPLTSLAITLVIHFLSDHFWVCFFSRPTRWGMGPLGSLVWPFAQKVVTQHIKCVYGIFSAGIFSTPPCGIFCGMFCCFCGGQLSFSRFRPFSISFWPQPFIQKRSSPFIAHTKAWEAFVWGVLTQKRLKSIFGPSHKL